MELTFDFEREEVLKLQEIETIEDGYLKEFISVTLTTTIIIFWSTISNHCGAY